MSILLIRSRPTQSHPLCVGDWSSECTGWTVWEDGESSFSCTPFQRTCLMRMTKALSGDSPALRCGYPLAGPQGTDWSFLWPCPVVMARIFIHCFTFKILQRLPPINYLPGLRQRTHTERSCKSGMSSLPGPLPTHSSLCSSVTLAQGFTYVIVRRSLTEMWAHESFESKGFCP